MNISKTLISAIRLPGVCYWAAVFVAVVLFFLLRKEKIGKRIAVSLLAAYLLLVLGSTVIYRNPYSDRIYKLELFRSYKRIVKKGIDRTRSIALHMVLNILLLSPIGFLMPVFVKKKRWVIYFGFLFSLLIELLQFRLKRGYFEMDDLFNNTLGVVLACGCFRVAESIVSKANRCSEKSKVDKKD